MVHHVRGEKVVFGKGDFFSLDALPSCEHHDAVVLAPPRKKSWTRRILKLCVLAVFLVILGIGALWFALENGSLDSTLTAQAENAMSRALGSNFEPKVKAVRLRFSSDWMLALEAVDVNVTHVKSGVTALKTSSIKAVLDPLSLLRGKVVLARAEIASADGDISFLPAGPGINWEMVRVDGVPGWLALLYPQLDQAVAQLDRAGTREVRAGAVTLKLPGPQGRVVRLDGFDFSRQRNGQYTLATALSIDKLKPYIAMTLGVADDAVRTIDAKISGIQTEPFAMKYSKLTGERRQGIDMPIDISLAAVRDKSLTVQLQAGAGTFHADGTAQEVKSGRALLTYDFSKQKVEVSEGGIDLGDTMIPFNGAITDLDKVTAGAPHGYAFELLANDAIANSEEAGEEPEPFNAKAVGRFVTASRELQFDEMSVATSSGMMVGSLKLVFGHGSPAISFSARSDSLSTKSIKQLWPYWFAAKPRSWVLTHIRSGEVRNAEIDVSLAAGRLPEHPTPFHFEEGEFKMSFAANGLDIRYLGELPAASNTSGTFRMVDRNMVVEIDKGAIPLPSGKILNAQDGTLTIADTAVKPLMASISLKADGDASAAAEYASFKPINAMAKAPFAAVDLSGTLKGDISAVFGLNPSQNPPKPEWNVALALKNVSLAKPIENRKLTDINGTLKIDNKMAALDGKADIDGMNFDVKFSQPVKTTVNATREWEAKGELTEAEVLKFAPALAPYLQGGVSITMDSATGGQRAKVSLTDTSLSIPYVNWRKGAGIRASAEFTMAARDGQTRITDFKLEGDGFGARGDMVIDKRGLVSGKFTRVKLSPADNFSLTLQRKSSGLSINVSGASIDAKPFIEATKSPPDGDATGVKSSNTINVKIERAVGYNKESLSGLNVTMATSEGRISTLSLTGVTESQQALVIRKDTDQGAMEITSGDAGAIARFADIYRNMNGGLLNITLKARDADSWRGSIDIRNFSLINEARLKSIVSARNSEDGRSLSDALKTDIDTSSQKFRRAFARLIIDGSAIKVENGIVRGDQLGATFQGIVRSRRGNMDMTGTFMPAYGLNSLFGQLPLIGAILGNGRDRGLLGITFKLEGPYQGPKMTVNPLSLIAPGVFRNIFEFQ
ncbi:MAG: uncharacterized protein JWL86_677 [Rhizobium sp.]|nr:uncharacterized protein [Rhizobium sp.]